MDEGTTGLHKCLINFNLADLKTTNKRLSASPALFIKIPKLSHLCALSVAAAFALISVRRGHIDMRFEEEQIWY